MSAKVTKNGKFQVMGPHPVWLSSGYWPPHSLFPWDRCSDSSTANHRLLQPGHLPFTVVVSLPLHLFSLPFLPSHLHTRQYQDSVFLFHSLTCVPCSLAPLPRLSFPTANYHLSNRSTEFPAESPIRGGAPLLALAALE